jgi:hypothetical protein
LRDLLDEAIDRRRRRIDWLVEVAVDLEWAFEPDGAQRDAAALILCDHRRCDRLTIALREGRRRK